MAANDLPKVSILAPIFFAVDATCICTVLGYFGYFGTRRSIRAKEIYSKEYSGHCTKRANSFPRAAVVEQILLAIGSFVAVKFVGPSAQVRRGRNAIQILVNQNARSSTWAA
jgi:hypothetical protein